MGAYASWVQQTAAQPASERRGRLWNQVLEALRRGFAPSRQTGPGEPWDGHLPFLEAAIRRARPLASLPPRPRIAHLIGTLGPGGAERQLCNFVIAAHRQGHDIRVLLMWEPQGEHAHYYHRLEEAGVPVVIPGATFNPAFPAAIRSVPGGIDAVQRIPRIGWPVVVDLLGDLLVDPPHILHCWLDGSNLWGGIAGLLAQVPRIILSTRNVNPMHFPSLAQPHYQNAYRAMLRSPTVQMINNSHPGARDYARWLGIPERQVSVVLNGLDVSGLLRPDDAEIAAFRGRLLIPSQAPIVAGVFRLAEEKQPFVFLDVIRRLRESASDAVAVVAGIGPLESAVREYVDAHRLPVRLLGRLHDVTLLYASASVTLLCSRQEGTPNVLLESQWLGCPVVATKAGGAVDVVDDGVTGLLTEVGDVEALHDAVARLLADHALRARMARSGPALVESRFSVERMVNDTLNVYGIANGRQVAV